MKHISTQKALLLFLCAAAICFACACQSAPDEGDTAPVSTDSSQSSSVADTSVTDTQPDTATDVPSTPIIPAGMESTLPSSGGSASQGDADNGAAQEISADMQTANSLIGQEVSALYDAIGKPADSSYVQSCLGDGDDGELYYEGFTVVTYREGDSEVIRGVY